jgi:NADH-quinone oxidoreductase subunit E
VNELLNQFPDEIRHILAKYPPEHKRSAIMPLLYLAQRDSGRVSQERMADIAEITATSLTEVASVAGFYSLFHEEPGGRYRIQICTDLPCALRGADAFLKQVCNHLGVKLGETTSDGRFTVEAVKCLAACHRAPMFQMQGDGEIQYFENQTLETFKEIVAGLRRTDHRARRRGNHE